MNWADFTVIEEQRKDLLRQVEKQRLIGEALAGRRQYGWFFSFILAWLI